MLRREAVRLIGSGSIWEEMRGLYPRCIAGATARESPVLEWRFPSGSLIELRHLQHEKDVHAHQGKQYAAIYFDEVCEFTERQFWYMLSRLRTTCGIRPYVRGTCNPDPDSFVRRMIDWWIGPDGLPIMSRSGVLRWFVRDGDDLAWFDTEAEARASYPTRNPLSFTFIAATLRDNPKGDPTYADRLDSLPSVERARLRDGNWDIRPAAGMYFRRPMFDVLEQRPIASAVKRRIRAWDKAATPANGSNDPDWTVGVLLAELHGGGYVVEHVERLRGAPAAVDAAMRTLAEQDGVGVEVLAWQDPGQAGVVDVEHMRTLLKGFRFRALRASQDKITYAGVWQSQAEGRRISIMRGPWLEPLLATLEAFPDGKHDDDVDALSLAFQAMFGGLTMEAQVAAYSRGFS